MSAEKSPATQNTPYCFIWLHPLTKRQRKYSLQESLMSSSRWCAWDAFHPSRNSLTIGSAPNLLFPKQKHMDFRDWRTWAIAWWVPKATSVVAIQEIFGQLNPKPTSKCVSMRLPTKMKTWKHRVLNEVPHQVTWSNMTTIFNESLEAHGENWVGMRLHGKDLKCSMVNFGKSAEHVKEQLGRQPASQWLKFLKRMFRNHAVKYY